MPPILKPQRRARRIDDPKPEKVKQTVTKPAKSKLPKLQKPKKLKLPPFRWVRPEPDPNDSDLVMTPEMQADFERYFGLTCDVLQRRWDKLYVV